MPQDGKIVALDVSEEFTSIAAKYWKDAGSLSILLGSYQELQLGLTFSILGVAHKIDLRLKPAVESLKAMCENPSELNSYDLAFIDADKPNYDKYLFFLFRAFAFRSFLTEYLATMNTACCYCDLVAL